MKKRILIIVIALAMFDLVFVRHALAKHRLPEATPTIVKSLAPKQATEPSVQEFYPVLIVSTTRPLEVPGQVLAPGKYSFELLNGNTEVAIASLDGSEIYGSYRLAPAWRSHAEDGLVETEGPASGTERLVSWFFPEQLDGYAFLYSESGK